VSAGVELIGLRLNGLIVKFRKLTSRD